MLLNFLHKKKKSFQIGFAFIFPLFILMICFWEMNIFPFGDYTVYTWDLSGQYAAFLTLLRNILHSNADGIYSFSGGLGDSLFGLFAYYMCSPFNLVLFFFNEVTMPIGIWLIICLKTSCMSGFMYLYLNHKHASFCAIFFSTAYALCSFAITYQSNIMWLDALVFLPLVIWGIEKLIHEKNILFYSIFLGITIISNYYMGFIVCLFCVLYFCAYLLWQTKEYTYKNKFYAVMRFGIASLCSGGLSAFILLPAIKELSASAYKTNTSIKSLTNWARIYLQTRLIPLFMSCAYDDSHRWDIKGFPLIYCGLIALIGLLAFFLSRNIALRKKCFAATILGFIFISYNHMNLFLLWHGMYSPFGAPWRFAFVGTFIILTIAYEGFIKLIQPSRIHLPIVVSICMLLYFFYVYLRCIEYRPIVLPNFIIASCFILAISLWNHRNHVWQVTAYAICILTVSLELYSNTTFIWNQGFSFDTYSSYLENTAQIKELSSRATSDIFYRTETVGIVRKNMNNGFQFNLNTLTMYSSTVKRIHHNIISSLGYDNNEIYLDYRNGSTAFANSLLCLRYLYSSENICPNYELIYSTNEELNLYENNHILPLVFTVRENASKITEPASEDNLFEYQNNLFSALTGSGKEHPYSPLNKSPYISDISYPIGTISYVDENIYTDGVSFYSENLSLINDSIQKTSASTLAVDVLRDSHITATLSNDGSAKYACFSIPYDKNWHATVNGVKVEPVQGMGGFLMVPVETGIQEIDIKYQSNAFVVGCIISTLSSFLLYVYGKFYLIGKSKREEL